MDIDHKQVTPPPPGIIITCGHKIQQKEEKKVVVGARIQALREKQSFESGRNSVSPNF